ncbi:MAG TPA: hypothetical protein VGF55_26470 [Gemmataceae bacterium]|jgi:hypothetical protein
MARRIAGVCLAGLWLGPFAAADPPPPAQTAAADANADDLALAAACLDRGEEAAAVAHLSRHLAAHPDRPLVRFSLAELLWRRDRQDAARVEYERFLRDAPPHGGNVGRFIHAHTRVMTAAERAGDGYGEHLHRGIGLYLLADQDVDGAEGLLCKAAGELTLASRERPAEARPHWYLYLVWGRLAQSQPAGRHLRRAADLAAHADLSPAERRDLSLVADAAAPPR